ncbi:circularly permuted type 2 ATP-grasp protein [Aeoliella mucimassa]|nr:circularly permuted type 2 ATP-grasp protein [Aeoliella mucimassa]
MAGPQPAAVPTASGRGGLFAGYQPHAGRHDELLLASGEVRPTWAKFCSLINPLASGEFTKRWNHSQRLIYENGISYSAYGDLDTSARPWDLDALPLLLDEPEWQQVSAGIAQRALVLQLTLADLLGPQRLLSEGVLPPGMLFGHTGFRLPFHGQAPPNGSFLPFYAVDLGRAPDGRWWVMADRTEAPSGMGFALENRVVISRMLPEAFRGCNVERLAPFFIKFKEKLQSLAPHERENPRIAVYTRGPQHENYFEDAYLARYLGYNLVEGDDLAVRDNTVWLKTLDGLRRIDVLLRRPNSQSCDPLEFSDESQLGVAGLLHSARSGEVAVVNPLGSGLVESPVFMAFLPRLCSFLLKQDLQLPGVASWWCGEPSSLDRVLANLDQYVVISAFRTRGNGHGQEREFNQLPIEKRRELIKANPTKYVAQEKLQLSTTPTWEAGTAKPAHLVLRTFAIESDNNYQVLPGGLARTSAPTGDGLLPVPTSHGSKDAWVQCSQPVEQVSLLATREEPVVIRRTTADLPSRVADNIYWLGRYIERIDAAARQLRTFILRLTSESSVGSDTTARLLLRSLAAQGQIEPGFALDDIRRRLPDIETALPRQVFDRQQPGSLRTQVDSMVHTASLVRDRMSTDSWRIMVHIDQTFCESDPSGSMDLTDMLHLLNSLVADLAAIQGLSVESMTRSHVYRFLDLGRRLERGLQTTELLDSCLVEVANPTQDLMEAVVEIADSLMTYRARYRANVQLPAVIDLLVTDESNPRSIAYQLVTLQQQVEELPGNVRKPSYLPHERLILKMLHSVRMLDVVQVCEAFAMGERQALTELIHSLDRDLQGLSRELSLRYLVHAGPSRRMSTTAPADESE